MNKNLLTLLDIKLEQSKFEPTWYWTDGIEENAERINRPHINAEGECENRIIETIDLLNTFKGNDSIDIKDMFNIQNFFLKQNNYKGIKPGLRTHNVAFVGTPDWQKLSELTYSLFPVNFSTKEDLLLWYKVIQKIHPLSDLNGRVFGTIVAILYKSNNEI